MTKFDKTLFNYDGLFLMYDGAFIARFKRGGMSSFRNFLIKNFTVEEYFSQLENSTPIEVLETRGYVSDLVAKALKSVGYPATQAGKRAYLDSLIAGK